VAQLYARPDYDHRLVERVVRYLETKDASLFPFTAGYGHEQRMAFMRDLRRGLAALQDSGSARKTAAVGFIMSDDELQEIIETWRATGGGFDEPVGEP
jgi:hypothetical protein